MPSIFGSISEILASLSPRRQQPADRQPQHWPSNRSNPTSARRSPSPNPAALRRRTKPARSSLGSQAERKQNTPHHIRFSSLTPDRDIDVSEQVRASQLYNARPRSAFLCLLGDDPQMSNQDPKKAAQDEVRLLGGKKFKDANPFKITPGDSFKRQKKQKLPGANAAFRPHDGISRNSRQSGPVRAQGKGKQPAPIKSPNPLGDAFEPSDRPIKKRRQSEVSEGCDVVNDHSLSRRHSPAQSSQISTNSKSYVHPLQQSEFREVENVLRVSYGSPRRQRRRENRQISTHSPDERFTLHAAQQRHSIAVVMESPNSRPRTERPARDILETIEEPVSDVRKTTIGDQAIQSPSAEKNGLKRKSDFRESSDELQGEVTTQPIPKHINQRHAQPHLPTKERNVTPDLSSPTDIKPTDFSSKRRAKRKHKTSEGTQFGIIRLQFGNFATEKGLNGKTAAIYVDDENIKIGEDIFGTAVTIPLRKVVKIIHGKDPSRKSRLVLSHGSSPIGNLVDIQFSDSEIKNQLSWIFKEKPVKMIEKERDYMTSMFDRQREEIARCPQQAKRPLLDVDPTPPAPADSSARQKLSSTLQGPADGPSSKRVKRDFSSFSQTGDGAVESRSSVGDGIPQPDTGVEIPVKKFQVIQPTLERETRSTRRTTRNTNCGTEEVSKFFSPKAKDENRQKWKKPMVYPRTGKKRAEVSVDDRDRLCGEEFLNDNLIGFYLRFLEDHLERTNKNVANRVYFFNSYFFATLTNTPKGERGINYSGVEKWTRNIDLFSYDYIVVPINQNAHWYVAIICNLPSLDLASAGPVDQSSAPVSDKEVSTQPESVHEILESPEPEQVSAATTRAEDDTEQKQKESSESPLSHDARKYLASMKIVEEENKAAIEEAETPSPGSNEKRQEDNGSADDWPEGEENQTSSPLKFSGLHWDGLVSTGPEANQSSPNTKKKGRTGPKLHPAQPTIITFDSLDLGRSPQIKLLREYICQEAASKRGVEVDEKDIKGMRARQIPLQPNYSDCGLYLLAYIEKFVQNPDTFITKLLQRDMDGPEDWPQLRSGLLRKRLRDFLDDLYEEQKQQEGQSILADQKPISFLLGSSLLSQDYEKEKVKEGQPTNPLKDESPKKASENSASEANGSKEDSAADEPRLVPTSPVHSKASEQTEQHAYTEAVKSSAKPSIKSPAEPSTSSKDTGREVVEVPDSQEPKTSRDGKKKSKKKEKRKSTAFPDPDAFDPGESKPEQAGSSVKIVRETPPLDELERPKRSPRDKRKG
ncbi:hypothetical protein N7490_003597 [Penicillium lividum]|nr:hypothetical protein N7490_003597 [Penicillium lividum]